MNSFHEFLTKNNNIRKKHFRYNNNYVNKIKKFESNKINSDLSLKLKSKKRNLSLILFYMQPNGSAGGGQFKNVKGNKDQTLYSGKVFSSP
jgi:hypothetical protein